MESDPYRGKKTNSAATNETTTMITARRIATPLGVLRKGRFASAFDFFCVDDPPVDGADLDSALPNIQSNVINLY